MSQSLPPDELLLGDLALAPLLGALTADATPGELAGQHAALAMYRAAHVARSRAGRFRRTARLVGRARSAGGRARGAGLRGRGVRLATVTALAVLAGGFAAAHLLFGFPGSHGGVAAVPRGPGHGNQGGSHGGAHPAQSGQAGPSILTVPGAARRSPSDLGLQTLSVSLSLHAAKHGKRDILLVRCRFAAPGDVVRLQVRQGSQGSGRRPGGAAAAGSRRAGHQVRQGRPDGAWQTVGHASLGKNGEASFEIAARVGLAYRVVLLATSAHGRLVSDVIVITVRDLRWKP